MPNQVVSFFKGQGIDPIPYDGDERKAKLNRLADPEYLDSRPQEYFLDQRDDFIRTLVAMGIPQIEVKEFIEQKGVYTLDAELMAHCCKMGYHYDRPLGTTLGPEV